MTFIIQYALHIITNHSSKFIGLESLKPSQLKFAFSEGSIKLNPPLLLAI